MSTMKLAKFSFLSAFLVALIGVLAPVQARAASGATITNIQIGYDGAQTTRLVIDASKDLDYSQFALVNGGLRYVIDFEHLSWDLPSAIDSSGEGQGVGGIQRYRYAQNSKTKSRLVLDLDEPLLLESAFTMSPKVASEPYKLVLDFRKTDLETFSRLRPAPIGVSASVEQPATMRSVETVGEVIEKADFTPVAPLKPVPALSDPVLRANLPVVVIDAGHGGKDPGAIGSKGTFEKDVVLKAALSLRDALVDSGQYVVILTREGDEYVDHADRIAIAREADADLFISLHADSAGNHSVTGASVYTLAPSADERLRDMREREDWNVPLEVDLSEKDVEDILVDLMTRETQNYSAEFAEVLIPQMAKAGPVVRNTHRRANFYVLLSPNVPAVLLELGFLTNSKDETRLTSGDGIEKSMGAVKSAIDIYFEEQRRLGARY